MKIQVRVNTEGVVRNQRFAFTNRFSLVSELLQNARRAGATSVCVEHAAETQWLRVRDNGRGIADFQRLLTFHESGWEEAAVQAENPFGIGFTKCLYAANRVHIGSRNQRVAFDCAAALRGEEIEVMPCETPTYGTVIALEGVAIPDLDARMEELCWGFPIPVVFNGKRLPRRYAEDQMDLVQTPVGAVTLAGRHNGRTSQDILVFLQGFCVARPPFMDMECVNVVHLDPTRFVARLPDRDTLIDADHQLADVKAALKTAWRETLIAERSALPAQQFADLYFAAMRSWGHLDLLNEVDALPAAILQRIMDYPIQSPHYDRAYLHRVAVPPSREDIESGYVTMVALSRLEEFNAPHWMLAWHKRWLVCEAFHLHANHWARPHIRMLDQFQVKVEAVEEATCVRMAGRKVQPLVTLCRSVRIRVGDDEVEVCDEGVLHEGRLLIPAEACGGEPVRQVSDYVDSDEHYCESDMEADRDALSSLVQRLRCADPGATLHGLLAGLRLGTYPQLHGRTFNVTIGCGGMPGYTVDLRPGPRARAPGAGARDGQR